MQSVTTAPQMFFYLLFTVLLTPMAFCSDNSFNKKMQRLKTKLTHACYDLASQLACWSKGHYIRDTFAEFIQKMYLSPLTAASQLSAKHIQSFLCGALIQIHRGGYIKVDCLATEPFSTLDSSSFCHLKVRHIIIKELLCLNVTSDTMKYNQ